jgi:purine catabolism regulator
MSITFPEAREGVHDGPRVTTTRIGEYQLEDLIAEDELGLELVSGDEACGARPIVGAQTSEIAQPTRYLDRDWVLLMTGIGLPSCADEQGALIAELEAAGIAALGFAVGIVHADVPDALLDEARRRAFPVFTVPREVCFRDVVSTVYRNVLSQEIRAAHRLTAMHRYLMDALAESDPTAAIVDRLETLINARVGILRRTGQIALSSGFLPGEEILREVGDRRGGLVRFETAGHRGLALPIEIPGSPDRSWLVIATDARRQLHPLAHAAAQVALPVLVAVARLTRTELEQRRLVRRGLLDVLLEPDDRRSAGLAAVRAKDLGLDIADGITAVVVAESDPRRSSEDLLLAVESELMDAGIPALVSISHDAVCAALPAHFIDCSAYEYLRDMPAVRVGVGRTVFDPMDVAQSFADARLALRHAVRTDTVGVVCYEEMNFGTVMLNELSVRLLGPKVDAWLEPLYGNSILYETVSTYFANHLDVMRTAEALSLHPNSVRYRLKRIEDTIGATLMEPETIAALHVALRTRTQVL